MYIHRLGYVVGGNLTTFAVRLAADAAAELLSDTKPVLAAAGSLTVPAAAGGPAPSPLSVNVNVRAVPVPPLVMVAAPAGLGTGLGTGLGAGVGAACPESRV